MNPRIPRYLLATALVVASVSSACALPGHGADGARGGGGARGGSPRTSGPRGQQDGGNGHSAGSHSGGGRGGDRHHHPPFPYWWYGPGFYGAGFFGSAFYDPFYDASYRRLGYEDRERKRKENVEIRVTPSSATVLVNGIQYGSRGKAYVNLASGDWQIEIRAPGYLPETVKLHVEPGIQYKIERKLEKEPEASKGRKLPVEELGEPKG